jgi:hypothetical protein
MYYQDEKNGYVYINYERIWQLLETIFGLNGLQVEEILKVWLEETYNLRGVTPRRRFFGHWWTLEETYKIKKPH